jgi:hypothetical protein
MKNIVESVKRDLDARAALGLKKYGVGLERTDLSERDWVQHAYEEALDLACYLRRLLEEFDAKTESEKQKQCK